MTRPLTQAGLAEALAENVATPWLLLIQIDHPGLTTPIRLARNTEPVQRLGQTYKPAAFNVAVPVDKPDAPPRTTLQAERIIDEEGTDVVALIAGLSGEPTATLTIVRASTPDEAEYGPVTLDIVDVNATSAEIRAELNAGDTFDVAYPGEAVTPALFPALFAQQ